MMKALFPPFLVLLFAVNAFGAEPAAHLKSAPIPFYPALARQARVTGTVTLDFVITEQGDTSEIKAVVESEAVNAKELLRQAAMDNLQNWKFAWPNPCSCQSKRKVIFSSAFQRNGIARETICDSQMVWKTDVIRVEIEADLLKSKPSRSLAAKRKRPRAFSTGLYLSGDDLLSHTRVARAPSPRPVPRQDSIFPQHSPSPCSHVTDKDHWGGYAAGLKAAGGGRPTQSVPACLPARQSRKYRYRRRLPHLQKADAALFVTFCTGRTNGYSGAGTRFSA